MPHSATSAASSASTSPLPLTPQSTGGGPDVGIQSRKTARRQTAVYNPNSSSTVANSPKPLKPFSRSAAKRESVLALGSIEHLQHYFSQTGIASKKNPLLNKFRNQGLVPAIGGIEHVPLSPPPSDVAESHTTSLNALLRQPPHQREQQNPQILTPHVKTHQVHPDSLLPGVIYDLTELVKAWQLISPTTDVLRLLKTSTRAIDSVRNYVLSLPDESTAAIRARSASSPSADPLAAIRRSALEVLSSMQDLEERARLPLLDDAYDAQSDGGHGGTGSRVASPSPPMADDPNLLHDPSITFSLVQVNGRVESVPVWVDEDDFDPFDDGTEAKRERWDQRLELGNGWLYRTDMKPEDLEKEKAAVEMYIKLTDEALFHDDGGGKDGRSGERGFEKARRKLEERASRISERAGSSSSLKSRSRSKNRRVSAADAMETGSSTAQALFLDTSGGRRRISTGILGLGKRVSDEPESMEGISEEGNDLLSGGIKEEGEGEGNIVEQEEIEEVEDDELPNWAQRSTFKDDDLGRAYTFLQHFLPQPYHYAMVPPSSSFNYPPPSPSPYFQISPTPSASRTNFLSSLSSGQLLCLAYNGCVRKSKHSWGFVSREGVHDVLGLEAREREREATGIAGSTPPQGQHQGAGWTFRRTDNLRLWIGALKLRYVLPLQMPSHIISGVPPSMLQLPGPGPIPISKTKSQPGNVTPASKPTSPCPPISPTASTSNGKDRDKDKINFDAKVVGRQEQGWEDMLEGVLIKWMWTAIDERRRVY